MEKRKLGRSNGVGGKVRITVPTTTKLIGKPAVGEGAIEWVPRPPKQHKSLLSRLFPRDK